MRVFSIIITVVCFSWVWHPHALAQSQASADTIVVAKTMAPEWVKVIEPGVVSIENRRFQEGGQLFSLVDLQVKWRPDGYEFYTRFRFEVVDRAGLEDASRVSYDFDPSDTQLAFNHIRVIREGIVQERLPGTEFEILRQESGLEDGIIDGTRTAFAELDDIRVGDIIDYALSGTVETKLWPGHFFDEVSMGWSVPVGLSSYRLVWPEDLPIYFRRYHHLEDPIIVEAGDHKVYHWQNADPTPIPAEEGEPYWHVSRAHLSISTMDSWEDIQAWAEPYYEIDGDLPEAWLDEVAQIKKRWKKKEDRMTAALRLVQDKVRYVGIEIGLGSHVPRQPDEVVARGYGDCKDKSLLLALVLKKLGVKAWTALTDIDQGPALPDYLPSPYAFDHMIVKAQVGKKTYWLDPTNSHQGARGADLAQLHYAYALPVAGKRKGLEPIELSTLSAPTLDVDEEYLFPENGDEALILSTHVVYQGYGADAQRVNLANMSKDQLQRNYLEYYQDTLKGLTIKEPIAVEDDLEANKIQISANFSLSKDAAGDDFRARALDLKAYAVQGHFYLPSSTDRTTPLEMPIQLNLRHRIALKVPGRRPQGIENTDVEFEGIRFARAFEAEKDTLQILFTLTSGNTRTVGVEDFMEALKFGEKVGEESSLTFTANKTAQSLGAAFGIEEDVYAEYEQELVEAIELVRDKKNIEAIQVLNALLEKREKKDKLYGVIQLLRGQTLDAMGRKSGAREAFAAGLQYYTDDANSYFRLTTLYRNNKELEKSAQVLVDLAKNLPEHVNSLRLEWLAELGRQLVDEDLEESYDQVAVALAEAGYIGDKKSGAEWIYQRAIKQLVKTGDLEAATGHLPKITNAAVMFTMLIDRQYETLWPSLEEKAGSDLGKAIAEELVYRKARFEGDPQNYRELMTYLHALRAANRSKEAYKIAKPYFEDWARIEATGEDAFWFVNLYAHTLRDLGKKKAALKAYQKVQALKIEDFPSTVSMRINHAIMLLEQGSMEEALETSRAIDADYASDFGKMFIWYVQVCSLHEMGKGEEAQAVFSKMKESPEANMSAFSDAVLCQGNFDKAEELLIERLQDSKNRVEALSLFQKASISTKIPKYRKKLVEMSSRVQARHAVQEVFEKIGRVIEVKGPSNVWTSY